MTPRRLGALGVIALVVTAGCGLRGVAVPELDALRLNRAAIHAGSTPDEVRALLGPPPFSAEDRVAIRWWYPVRVLTRGTSHGVPAAELKVWFDDAGRVDEWGFTHPVSGARLPVRETLPEVERWFGDYCQPPPRIELATARAGPRDAHVLCGPAEPPVRPAVLPRGDVRERGPAGGHAADRRRLPGHGPRLQVTTRDCREPRR